MKYQSFIPYLSPTPHLPVARCRYSFSRYPWPQLKPLPSPLMYNCRGTHNTTAPWICTARRPLGTKYWFAQRIMSGTYVAYFCLWLTGSVKVEFCPTCNPKVIFLISGQETAVRPRRGCRITAPSPLSSELGGLQLQSGLIQRPTTTVPRPEANKRCIRAPHPEANNRCISRLTTVHCSRHHSIFGRQMANKFCG